MPDKAIGKTRLASSGFASPIAYELHGDLIIGRLFGIFTVRRIHLAAVHYLRLATRFETPPIHQVLNWIQFLPHRRSVRPVYVLQTRAHHRIFLKLDGTTHFKLRQAIGRHSDRKHRMAA